MINGLTGSVFTGQRARKDPSSISFTITGSPDRADAEATHAPNFPGAIPARVAATRGGGKIRKSEHRARFT